MMSDIILQPLTYCKNKACGKPITVKNVFEEVEIEEAPHHIIIAYKCFHCTQEDQMVGTRESWEAFLEDDEEEEGKYQKEIRAAEVEVNAIKSAQDLINLWHSYRRAPLFEDVMGSCQCDDCRKRIYYHGQ